MRTLAEIKGFGPVRLKALAARGIETALDLVETLPTGYKDTTHPLSPAQMTEGRQACFTGFVKGKPALHRVRGMQWVSATIADAFGAVRCMWFNQPWMKDKLFDTARSRSMADAFAKRAGCSSSIRRWKSQEALFPYMLPCRGWGRSRCATR
ncbi:MAG: hypothetical protein ACLSVU_07750 [Christensenellales bacterium]